MPNGQTVYVDDRKLTLGICIDHKHTEKAGIPMGTSAMFHF